MRKLKLKNVSIRIMTQTGKKSINQWTRKHNEFCLENKLSPCARFLWQWLLEYKDDEPDLKDFNKWVINHRGKPYCRPHIKAAFNQLVECRVIRLVKQFTWHLVRIVTRSLADLFPKKNRRSQSKSYAERASNYKIAKKIQKQDNNNNIQSYSDEDKKDILADCAKEGIIFNPKKTSGLFKHSPEDITYALLFYNGLDGRIKRSMYNRTGWFLDCLEFKYWEYSNLDFSRYISILEEIIPVKG